MSAAQPLPGARFSAVGSATRTLLAFGLASAVAAAGCGESDDAGRDDRAAAESTVSDTGAPTSSGFQALAEGLPPGAMGMSLLGEPLFPAGMPDSVRETRVAKLDQALAALQNAPYDADSMIWVGRRLAYLERYAAAIEAFTVGLAQHPEDARFYRHRGHRFITTRQLDRAIADLERAAELISGRPDEIEPDGLPNARGIPTGTLQSNIWYHLGLARYLEGDFEGALAAYRKCMAVSGNPDMLVATSHWLYMTLRRLGRDDEAAAILQPITPDLDVIENDSYHQLLLMYRGLVEADALWSGAEDDLTSSTIGYGVANWHLYNDRTDQALDAFRRITSGSQWAAFGYIAAEAELAR